MKYTVIAFIILLLICLLKSNYLYNMQFPLTISYSETDKKVNEKKSNEYIYAGKWNLENNKEKNYSLAIAIDKLNYVYVVDIFGNSIKKFDSSGTFITKFAKKGILYGQIEYPQAITVDSEFNVYVEDRNGLQKFDSNGNFIKIISYTILSYDINYINIDLNDNLYLNDFPDIIRKIDSSGKYMKKFRIPKETVLPKDYSLYVYNINSIAVDSSGYIYAGYSGRPSGEPGFCYPEFEPVKEQDIYSIIKVDPEGNFIKRWGGKGCKDGQFNKPGGVVIDKEGNILVADAGNNRIQKFDSNGTFLTKFGTKGSEDGQFYCPIGLAIDGEGTIYIVDAGNYRIQKFKPNPNFKSNN